MNAEDERKVLRPFSESDWEAFAGAEPFLASPETSPLTAEVEGGFIVVVDRSGIQVISVDREDDSVAQSHLMIDDNRAAATVLANLLIGSLRCFANGSLSDLDAALERLGFSPLENL